MTIRIPEWTQAHFEKKMKSLHKKVEFQHILTGTEMVPADNKTCYKCNVYDIVLPEVKSSDNWEFIGSIECLENGNIITPYSEAKDIPERFKTTECYCEHCQTVRNRNKLYIVKDLTTGEYKQVGSKCIQSYTGIDPLLCAASLSLEEQLKKLEDEEEESFRHGNLSGKYYYDNEIIKAISYNLIKEEGYRPTTEQDPTKEKVIDIYFSTDVKDNKYKNIPVCLEDIDKWVESQADTNNYYYTCSILVKEQYIEKKFIGFIASVIFSYIKAQQKKAMEEANAKSKSQNFIGSKGSNVEFTVKDFVVLYSSQYCYSADISSLYKITTNDNNIVLWRTTQDIAVGLKYSAKVKENKFYNGEAETVVTRGKLIGVPNNLVY